MSFEEPFHILPPSHEKTWSCFSFRSKCCIRKKKPDCHCNEHNSCSWEQGGLSSCWSGKFLYIIAQVNLPLWDKDYNRSSITAAFPAWCNKLVDGAKSRKNFCSALCNTFLHVSRTMNVIPEEQCNYMPTLSRAICKGPDITWKNVPYKGTQIYNKYTTQKTLVKLPPVMIFFPPCT